MAASTQQTQFITILEKNRKENEVFFYYCQWTGNEMTLSLLKKAIERANYEYMDGDYISLEIDATLLPESLVDIHKNLFRGSNNYHRMFTKCTGTFTCPLSEKEIESLDEYQIVELINDVFYGCRIPTMFSNYRNWYAELVSGKITKEEYEARKIE
jgi:hypothetical protein